MKLHMDIDCTSLDDLKSAKATIDRLIQEHEERADGVRKFLSESMGQTGKKFRESMREILNPPLRKEVVTDDATGDKFKVEPLMGDQWSCPKCGTANAGKAAKCMGCGK